MDQKFDFIGPATAIDALKKTFPGMAVFCTVAGGINNLELDVLYMRNSANNAWIKIAKMNQTASVKEVASSSPAAADWSDPVSVAVSSGGSAITTFNPNSPDNYFQLNGGTTERQAQKVTDAALRSKSLVNSKWKLSKNGSPTGTLVCRLRKVSDDSIVATATNSLDVSTLSSGSYSEITFTFSGATTPNEDFRISIEYTGGDASNFVKVGVHTGSGNTYAPGNISFWPAGASAWSENTSYDWCGSITTGSGNAINDNNTSTGWTSNSEANPWAYVEVAATSKPAGAIRVYWPSSGRPTNYKIQHSNDAATWTDLLTRSAKPAADAWTEYEFNVVYARYIRVLAQETLAMRVNEIDVYKQEIGPAIADHGHQRLT